MPSPLASVVILCCDKARFTDRCLDALARTAVDRMECILVDNGSTDETPEVLDRHEETLTARDGWSVKRIRFEENAGAVAGRNAALEEITGDYVVFLDNDTVAESPSWLSIMIGKMEADPTIGGVGPKLVYPAPRDIIQCAGCDVTPSGRVVFRGRGEHVDTPEYDAEREVQCVISACVAFRRAAVDEAGPLDMAFHPVQFEDIDYCYRIRHLGYRILYTPEVTIYHFENVTTDGTPGLNYTYLTVKNGLVFKKRWRRMFETENGPADETVEWRDIPRVSWDVIEDFLSRRGE